MSSNHEYDIRRVQANKNNNAYSIVLPKHLCQKLDINKGNYVKVTMDKEKKEIYIEKAAV